MRLFLNHLRRRFLSVSMRRFLNYLPRQFLTVSRRWFLDYLRRRFLSVTRRWFLDYPRRRVLSVTMRRFLISLRRRHLYCLNIMRRNKYGLLLFRATNSYFHDIFGLFQRCHCVCILGCLPPSLQCMLLLKLTSSLIRLRNQIVTQLCQCICVGLF